MLDVGCDTAVLLEMVAQEKPRPAGVHFLRRVRYPWRDRYLNRYANMLIAVFQPEQARSVLTGNPIPRGVRPGHRGAVARQFIRTHSA